MSGSLSPACFSLLDVLSISPLSDSRQGSWRLGGWQGGIVSLSASSPRFLSMPSTWLLFISEHYGAAGALQALSRILSRDLHGVSEGSQED